MIFKILSFCFLISSCSFLPTYQRRCPDFDLNQNFKKDKDYSAFLAENNIRLMTSVDQDHLEHTLYEFNKVPKSLVKEMVSAGAVIHLIQGNSVTDDPTWDKNSYNPNEKDWRSYEMVSGTGGLTYLQKNAKDFNLNRKRICKSNPSDPICQTKLLTEVFPARLVINKMPTGGTSVILHEIGHTIDNLYSFGTISSDPRWDTLINSDKHAKDFLILLCDGNYCADSKAEAFAELFSYYHSCPATREHMEKEIPKVATFFHNLHSVFNFINEAPIRKP